MIASSATLAADHEAELRLQYALSSDNGFAIASEMARARRGAWLRRLVAIAAACLAIQAASAGDWKTAALFGSFGTAALSPFKWTALLIKLLFRGVVYSDLTVDHDGIRGTLEPHMRFKSWSETRQINYAWRQIRQFDRLSRHLVLEFSGGSVIIPTTAFASADDLEQCVAWAEAGLAIQRMKTPDVTAPMQIEN